MYTLYSQVKHTPPTLITSLWKNLDSITQSLNLRTEYFPRYKKDEHSHKIQKSQHSRG